MRPEPGDHRVSGQGQLQRSSSAACHRRRWALTLGLGLLHGGSNRSCAARLPRGPVPGRMIVVLSAGPTHGDPPPQCGGPRPGRRQSADGARPCRVRPAASIARSRSRPWIWYRLIDGILAGLLRHHRLGVGSPRPAPTRLPSASMALAALSTIIRIASISIRARAASSRFLPRLISERRTLRAMSRA
jgi:hypothetical protein